MEQKPKAASIISNPAMLAFVQMFAKTPAVKTAAEFYQTNKPENHETWRRCKDCGTYFDWRKNDCCTTCGSGNFNRS